MVNSTQMSNSQPEANSSTLSNAVESREAIDLNLNGYWQKLKRRWQPALAVFLLTLATTGSLSTLLKKAYQAEGKLLFKQNTEASLIGVGESVGELKPLLNNQSPLSTQKEIITSQALLQQTIDQLKLQDNEGKPLKPEDLETKLDVSIIGGSDVIQIKYKNQDPLITASVVNTLMKLYIEGQIRTNQEESVSAGNFISQQLPQIEAKLSKAESELRRFREANNIVNLNTESETTVLELANLNRQIVSLGADLQGVQVQANTLQSQLGLSLQQAIAANQVGESPIVGGILDELATVEKDLAQERKRFKDNHPSIISLQDKKAILNQELQQQIRRGLGSDIKLAEGLLKSQSNKENQLEKFINLEINKLSLQRQVSSLYESQRAYLQRAKQLPRLQKEEQDLLREVEAAQTTYQTLLGSLQEVQIAQNQQTGNAKIIQLAQFPEKGSTGRLAFIVLGIILGLFLSNISVLLIEMQDRTLKSILEVRQKFSYPVLGIIPQELDSDNQGIVVQQEPDSFTSEIYRMIQANLKLLSPQKLVKVILITSSVPEEGKSTISANLAAAIAQLGRRVLLIDGDLRNPSQHRLWQSRNQVGLKDLLTRNITLSEVVFQPMPCLDLLTGGAIPPNPLAWLDSDEMNLLIAKGKQDYDLVIIDAPPLPVMADVLTLSKLVDGILFVSRPGIVDQESATLAKETLATTGQPILGMVINGVKPKEFERYSYHARYAKGYFSRAKSQKSYTAEAVTI